MYDEQICEIERGTFTPLVLATAGRIAVVYKAGLVTLIF